MRNRKFQFLIGKVQLDHKKTVDTAVGAVCFNSS